ncbi:hypothetical protein FRC03_012746 [Tulasnella sp. 419]|nr:hypothetical protein FRC03_012746 [Tulasnella sp. 419]
MKGLAMSNDKDLRNAHNSMARPADVREALSSIAIETSKLEKKKSTQRSARSSSRKKKTESTTQDVYHYIGFVPSNGKVWQLDGLVSGPLEVGNLPQGVQLDTPEGQKSWLTLVQPAITLQIEKMQSHGGDIRVNLLAITNSLWEKYSDEFELLRRERRALERRLNAEVKDWSAKSKENDPSLAERANSLFDGPNSHHSSPFDTAFGLRAQEKQMKVLQLPSDALLEDWRQVVDRAGELKALLEEEISKAKRWQSEYIKRTHDYEPFLRELLSALKSEGILDARLNE